MCNLDIWFTIDRILDAKPSPSSKEAASLSNLEATCRIGSGVLPTPILRFTAWAFQNGTPLEPHRIP